VSELRPLVGAVINRQAFAYRSDVWPDVGQKRPELKLLHPELAARHSKRQPKDPAVQHGRDPAVRQRDHQRRVHPQIRLDLFGPTHEVRHLRENLLDVALAAQLGRARRDRIQPQHAIVPGQFTHHVIVAGRLLVPVLGEADDVLAPQTTASRFDTRVTPRQRFWYVGDAGHRTDPLWTISSDTVTKFSPLARVSLSNCGNTTAAWGMSSCISTMSPPRNGRARNQSAMSCGKRLA